MRSVTAVLCVGLLLAGIISNFVPTAEAPPPQQYYLAYHDAIGSVYRTFDGSSATYSKYPGDPNLLQEYEPGDLPDQEERGYWRFTIPDFTDKNVKDVKLEFRTRNAQCLPPPSCVGTLTFKIDVFRLYQDPNAATPQQIYDGIHEYQGLPYLKWPDQEFTLQAQSGASVSLGPNAVADINHHEGGWYAIGMKVYEVRDGPDHKVWGRLEVCSLSSCAYPPPGPGFAAFESGPTPLYALPVLKIAYEAVTTWPQLHGDARHDGYSASLAPNTGNSVWRKTLCYAVPNYCHRTDYSPVAKDGKVYIAVNLQYSLMLFMMDYDEHNLQSISVDIPDNPFVAQTNPSVAVSNDLVVVVGSSPEGSSYAVRVFAFQPETLAPLWTVSLTSATGDIGRTSATIYGRYVLVGSGGSAPDTYGHLFLLKSRGSTVSIVWVFDATPGNILTPAVVQVDTVLVRASTKLHALPFVEPYPQNGVIESSEVRWTFDLGMWTGVPPEYNIALGSGPAVAGGYVYIGSHNAEVHKIHIRGPFAGTAVWTRPVEGPVQSTPGLAWGLVYVVVSLPGGVIPQYVTPRIIIRALSQADGSPVYDRTYDEAASGMGSPSLADGKLFLWMGDRPAVGVGGVYVRPCQQTWILVLDYTLAVERYRVTVHGTCADNPGGTPAIADGWVFAGNGLYSTEVPAPDSLGYIAGWNS